MVVQCYLTSPLLVQVSSEGGGGKGGGRQGAGEGRKVGLQDVAAASQEDPMMVQRYLTSPLLVQVIFEREREGQTPSPPLPAPVASSLT